MQKKTSKKILKFSEKKIICDNFFSRGTGLMLRGKNSLHNKIWIFKMNSTKKVSITMFLVFFPIDVVFIKNNTVVETKKNLQPFTLSYTTKSDIDTFIELQKGTISKKRITIGQKIVL